MEPPLQGSSHQPARERRAVAILRARSIPHRTMGAAILKRTKWNAGPGVRARGGRGRGRVRLRRKWTASDASPQPGCRSWFGPGPDNMATVFRTLERLRAPRPSLHPGVTGSGSACGRCTLGGTRVLTKWRKGGWKRRERETPAASLFGEGSGDLTLSLHVCAARFAGDREHPQLVPGKQKTARVWTRNGLRCSWRTFLTHRVSFSARLWYRL